MAKKQKQFFNFDEEDEDKVKSEWLCKACGKGKRYLGQIAGTCAKRCENCGSFDKLRFKYAKENV